MVWEIRWKGSSARNFFVKIMSQDYAVPALKASLSL